jgi:hypothetical protein
MPQRRRLNVRDWLTTDSPAMLPVRRLYSQKRTFLVVKVRP